MDHIDRRIVELLEQNAKLRIKEIAADVGMSTTPVFERIKRLEKEKVILGYHANVNHKKLGKQLVAICAISLQQHRTGFIDTFEADIVAFEEVVEVCHVAGQFDYLLKVRTTDMDAYQQFVSRKLASLQNIARVQSSFIMSQVK
jgi:DNA-binding Lrp family transcriptional regulator